MSRKLSLDEIKKRLKNVHGDHVTIVDSTFVSYTTFATFVDDAYGVWQASPKAVCGGRRHTKNQFINSGKNRLSSDEIATKLRQHHGMNVSLAENQQYVSSHTKMKFIDRDFGEFTAMPYAVLNGYSHHPARGQRERTRKSKIATEQIHWRSNKTIVCTASYELAVVKWLNDNRYDFDWQVPFKMPSGRTYYVDLHILSGPFANLYVEIKGTFARKGGDVSLTKWLWFHKTHPRSELWDQDKLKTLQIL